jgi:starch phosphorylase
MADAPTANSPYSAEPARSGLGAAALQRDIVDNLICLQARYPAIATAHDWYMALAYSVRDRMLVRWTATVQTYTARDARIA